VTIPTHRLAVLSRRQAVHDKIQNLGKNDVPPGRHEGAARQFLGENPEFCKKQRNSVWDS